MNEHWKGTQSLKITEKVAFNIASEASYVYILSGQKSPKNNRFGEFLKTWSLRLNSVRSLLIGQKLMENAKVVKLKCDIFWYF